MAAGESAAGPSPADPPASAARSEPAGQTEPADRPESAEPSEPAQRPGLTEEQRRRLAEIFGDVLPSTTSDERDERDQGADSGADERFLADRPPHHDRER
jgi:hypothetical protein